MKLKRLKKLEISDDNIEAALEEWMRSRKLLKKDEHIHSVQIETSYPILIYIEKVKTKE
jgi:hypothetical protein